MPDDPAPEILDSQADVPEPAWVRFQLPGMVVRLGNERGTRRGRSGRAKCRPFVPHQPTSPRPQTRWLRAFPDAAQKARTPADPGASCPTTGRASSPIWVMGAEKRKRGPTAGLAPAFRKPSDGYARLASPGGSTGRLTWRASRTSWGLPAVRVLASGDLIWARMVWGDTPLISPRISVG